ncbi:Hypothetical predicted protein [Mytilus galloprovincialis]|uniref:Mab-21-like HhH/H2TH-like domain-containing protein n=1 Tax=Mytilus galloprovincialis TaxID=29158 RepID=A0A8B6ER10_MYTGA|nr:Hypothetical predicted protein [Mytilus galloprovincialis]
MAVCLYDYLCQNIVGSAKYVRLFRLINASRDRIMSNRLFYTYITSGSFGEGLELKGSDFDIMIIKREMEVTEQSKLQDHRSDKAYFLLETNDVKPGFAYLRLIKGNTKSAKLFCRGTKGQLYISSVLFKMCILGENTPIVHGPCATDRLGFFDLAFCLHSKSWISTALQWVTRSSNSWPTSEVKQKVIDHGVLFVPIGKEGDLNEELKWRISFSIGEKFLICSFSHTQLLCYVLMKILLKDVISESPGCKDLLCSYFIKTILFWVSEELPTSVWKPNNLIHCFMRCFKRLVYCVEYSVCPHYFIPENNLFENKIIGHSRTKLLQKLNELNDYGWQCIFSSGQISSLPSFTWFTTQQRNADMFANNIQKIIKSKSILPIESTTITEYERCLRSILLTKSKKIRTIHLHNMTGLSLNIANAMQLSKPYCNKCNYKQYKTCICYILQSTHHDAVLGWLTLATLFYKHKQYFKALCVLSYSLTKCTTEKLSFGANITDVHRKLLRYKIFKKLKIIRTLRFLFLPLIDFYKKTSHIPDELKLNASDFKTRVAIPPVTYVHFLTFLCHYHLHNIRNYQESLGGLRLTIEEDYFMSDIGMKATAYDCLGVAFQIIGDTEAARGAFVKSTEIYPDQLENRSFKRLAMTK